jgi:hypothetical protein
MKLIREVYETVNLVTESKLGKGKQHFIEGVFLQSELKNRNGRVYPESVMDREVARYQKEYIDKNRAYGELGHPDTPSNNLERVSHIVTSLNKDGTNYIGKAKLLDTPMGKIAIGLLEGGAHLGVSSRALGSLKMNKEGVQVVQDDFMLSTAADIVADPSAPDAFVRGIMESKEWVMVDGKFVEKNLEEAQRIIKKTSMHHLEEQKLKLFNDFLQKIR